MKMTQVNDRFVVETEQGRMHILNEKTLKWNLKRVFKLSPLVIKGILADLQTHPFVVVAA